jgi:hypothetical protein
LTTIIHYPSPVQWLADTLAAALLSNCHFAIAPSTPHPSLQNPWMPLPLFTVDIQQFGTFASPLPLKLASQWQRSQTVVATPQDIGTTLIAQMSQQTESSWLVPNLSLHPEGWLYAHFSALELSKWLQSLLVATPLQANAEPFMIASGVSSNPVIFQLQYAHARCCSLLRLAQQEYPIHFSDRNIQLAQWTAPVIWQTPTGELQFQTLAEHQLLLALMQFPQSLSPNKIMYGYPQAALPGHQTQLEWPPSEPYLRRQAQQWSHIFLNFYVQCRILGDVQQATPELSTARLALVFILRRVLAFILEAALQVEAPVML